MKIDINFNEISQIVVNNNHIYLQYYTYTCILIIIHELYMNITIDNQPIMNICKV